jgi:AraC-like DNA-binding protein
VSYEVRAVILTSYVEVARFVGLDPYEMLRTARISPFLLEDPETRLPAERVVELLENSAIKSGCMTFGLLMSEGRSFENLGPLSLLLEHLPTVRDVTLEMADFRRHMHDLLSINLEEEGDTAVIRLDFVPYLAGSQLVDMSVSHAYRIFSGVSGGRWMPSAAHFIHEAPDDLHPFRRFFPCPVEFGCGFNGLSCPRSAMTIPNPGANAALARAAEQLLKRVAPIPEDAAVSDRVRRAIALLLPTGRATLEQVATNMDLSPRALQRRLEKERHSFASLLSETRRELALRYLINTERSITSVADLTGYGSLSAFGRWFATEFGMSPQLWRSENFKERYGSRGGQRLE